MSRMAFRVPALLLAVSLTGVLGEGTALAEDDAPGRVAALRVKVLEALHGLAERAGRLKLYGTRADIHEHILTLDPDDAEARKWLKFRRTKEGTWERRGRWRRPANLGKGAGMMVSARQDLVARFEPQLAAARTALLDAGDPAQAMQIVHLGLALAPDHVAFRTWNDEVRDPEASTPEAAWILVETQRARIRRPALRKVARDARANMPAPETDKTHKNDEILNVRWTARLQGRRTRVVGTPPKEELDQILRRTEAAWPLFEEAFDILPPTMDSKGRYAVGLSIYVFQDINQGNRFHAAWPDVPERRLTFTAPLVSLWIHGQNALLVKNHQQAIRFEAAPRQVLSWMAGRHFRLRGHRAWASEGLSTYLNWQITGTRWISSVKDVESAYAEGEKPIPTYESRIHEDGVDWLDLGVEMLRRGDKPNLHLMVGRSLNDLQTPEALYAYCICAYLCEGHPDRCVAFFRTLAGEHGTDIGRVCREVLGFGTQTLEARVHRWLEETTGERAIR